MHGSADARTAVEPRARRSREAAPSREFLSGSGELAELIRAKDWSQTPLGPIETWPQSLRTTVSLCLASNFPINIIWGPEHTQIYNDGYRVCCGDAHPRALGENYRVTWASAWPAIGESFERAVAGETMYLENQRMFLPRLGGDLEETFFTFSHSPIRDESGGIGGLFHPVTETTATMLAERRTRALRDLAASLGVATDEAEVARRTVEVLSRFEFDLPFLLVYTFDPNAACYRLAGHHGMTPVTAAAPARIAFEAAAPWPLAEALGTSRIVELGNLPTILQGESCGPYEEPPNRAFVVPIVVPAAEWPPVVIVTAASPRLPFNEAYRSFYDLLGVTISNALATVRAREDERRRAEALAEIDRAKTLFFSNVSHEFRTPLTLMLGPLEDTLAGTDLSAAQREQLEVARRNSLRLLKLVNSLLDFSRIEAGRAQASYDPADLAAITVDLASNFRSAYERAGLNLVVDCPPLPEPVYVDRDMWEKIVLNLLSNAFKFTFEGEVVVRLRAVEGQAELSIRDSGVGIREHELPRLFERFHRIEGQKSRTYEGSGIGLALVQELVALHGGRIRVESKVNHGTSFAVAIPFGTAHLPQDRIGAERSLKSTFVRADAYVQEALRWLPDSAPLSEAPSDIEEHGGLPALRRGARILLADDNADMRAYVRRLLGPYCDVQTVADGQAALDAIRARRPDLVLADVMMPRLDGFALLRAIRADPALRDLPVIMLSARAGEESRVAGLEAGADDYLVKPFSARELIARVNANVELAQVRRDATAALRESDERLRLALDAAEMGTFIWHVEEDRGEPDARMLALFGQPSDGTLDLKAALATMIHSDDASRYARAVASASDPAGGGELHEDIRVSLPDGSERWLAITGQVYFAGEPRRATYMAGTATDITERKLLLHELNHRVKNTLATVQSIAVQTLRHAATPTEGRHALEARLLALAKAHDVLTREQWEGAELHELVAGALSAYSTGNAESRFEIHGSDIKLLPRAVLAVSMALQELATNAVKYGALSNETGRVRIEWSLTHGDPQRFRLRWAESGGPPVAEPSRRGFGSRLIEQGLAHDMNADVHLSFAYEGLVCTIEAPADEIRAQGG